MANYAFKRTARVGFDVSRSMVAPRPLNAALVVMAKRDGKSLEELVSYVESALLPTGFSVETNDRVVDGDGNIVAEFDITISGRVGSTAFTWLVECRDRPGSGAAPAAWIEQLVGRRSRFGFNKVTAVSTTGFAPGAVAFAAQQGIELRSVAALSPEEFSDWLVIRTVQEVQQRCNLLHTRIGLGDEYGTAELESLRSALRDSPKATLKRSKDGVTVSFRDAFVAAVSERGGLFDDVVPGGAPKPINLRVRYTNPDDHFVVSTNLGDLRVDELHFQGELTSVVNDIPLAETLEYGGATGDCPIAQIARFAPQGSGDLRFSMELRKLWETGETHVLIRRVTDDN